MKTQTYARVAKMTEETNQVETKQETKYLALVERLLQVSVDEWSNFQKCLRSVYYETQEETKNKSKPETNETKPTNRPGSPAKNVTAKSKSQRSSIRSSKPMEDIPKTKTTKETTPKKQALPKKNTPTILTETTNRFERLKEMDVDALTPETKRKENYV